MKKLLFILFFSFITHIGYGQTTFTQTFVDRCTGDVQVVTANFVQGSAVVAFYDEVRTFTYQQFLNGQLQQWLVQKYTWWQALSPCSQAQQQTQQAQQTAQTASQAASAATNTTSNATSNTNTNSTTEGSNSNSSNSNESSSSESSGGSGEGESGGGEETSSEGSEPESEGGEAESESEESSEESEGGGEDEGEGGDDDKDSDDGKKSKKKKKKLKMMPIQLKADLMGQQSLLGTYNSVLNFGASQSSIFGDVNYGANLMVWDNLKQVGLSLNRAKVTLNDNYEAKWVDATSISYMRNYKMNALSVSLSRMKPIGRWGTVGVGINYAGLFGKDNFGEKMPKMYSLGWNVLYTNMVKISDRILYTPAIIGAQNPLSYTQRLPEVVNNPFSTVSKDFIGILSNSFTIQLTRRFSFNVGWTMIYSTNEFVPIMNAFMIGSKLPF
jgi:hypothetical protein